MPPSSEKSSSSSQMLHTCTGYKASNQIVVSKFEALSPFARQIITFIPQRTFNLNVILTQDFDTNNL
uniref:Uncharacterized protein n=1 Tax=Glossina brevipalpis TaxID=37001 RepID=A0A1A9W6W5_9MUSC